MKQYKLLLVLFCLIQLQATAQINYSEKYKKELAAHPALDTLRVNLLNDLAFRQFSPNEDRKKWAKEALDISRKIQYSYGEAAALANLALVQYVAGNLEEGARMFEQADSLAAGIGSTELKAILLSNKAYAMFYSLPGSELENMFDEAAKLAGKTSNPYLKTIIQFNKGQLYSAILSNYPKALESFLISLDSAEEAGDLELIGTNLGNLGNLYALIGDQEKATDYYQKAIEVIQRTGNKSLEANLTANMGESYRLSGRYPEAIAAYNKSIKLFKNSENHYIAESNLADVYTRIDSLPRAFAYAFRSITPMQKTQDSVGLAWVYGILSRASLKSNRADSAVYYGNLGLQAARQSNALEYLRDNTLALANAYAAKKDYENAYPYHLQYITYRDSMLSGEVRNKTSLLTYNSQLGKKEVEIAALNRQKKDQKKILYSIAAVLLLLFLSAILLLRNNRLKQKANLQLQAQKQKVETTLQDLKSTQAQLVQAEKMASLGELTAGIAHEIQNPLNFVNNFSEVSDEMLDELKEELEKGDIAEATALANQVKGNLQKITHHGKRADAIVKGMLAHSRQNSGEKILTDINTLADEYLRLSYHGLRAKDKSFNADFSTNFDPDLNKINVIPQDIGRVLLNLINNAFQAVHGVENAKVVVTTKQLENSIEITVADNGPGIPESIKEKIFQPFFTTKTTGQGTGLGLSLSYDIVKAHGGEIKVESEQGTDTTFTIYLPN